MYENLAPGLQVYSFESLSSTQDQARFMAGEDFPEGTIIVAKEQIVGKGRMGRRWVSGPGNLFMTYIARPECSVAQAAEMSFVSCVAVGDGMRALFGKKTGTLSYKWPNDMMLNSKKVGGILLETTGKNPNKVDAVLIGIGINLLTFPEQANYPVTSFLQEGFDVSLERALRSIAEYLQGAIEMWKLQGFMPIKKRWEEHAFGMGKTLSVREGDRLFQGKMMGLDASGALIMSSKLGATDIITAGDVMFGDVFTVTD